MAPITTYSDTIHAREVIRRLGDFSHIRSPAKCAARIGQAFSQTMSSIKVPREAIEIIKDVERNGRTFSDGVGTCSRELLHQIWDQYATREALKPTILQIRFQGAKGVISLDSRLEGSVLRLRPSMIKFEAADATDVEICGSATRALPMVLNHQLIKILEDLGVSHTAFLNLQNAAVERLRATTVSVNKAATFLKSQNVSKAARLPWLLRRLSGLSLSFSDDEFLRSVLEVAVLSQLREMKYRARIPVEKGVTLYGGSDHSLRYYANLSSGIMDETNTLQEEEIYCSLIQGQQAICILGNVVITRSPALHPGDVQCVRGIEVPPAHPFSDLHNVVVFSSKGARVSVLM